MLVAEADESDGSFCKYRPSIAVITNALADHLDHYGDEAHYCAAFVDHAGHASGHVVMTGDDEGAVAVLRDLDPSVARPNDRVRHQGCRSDRDLRGATLVRIDAEHESADSGRETFTVHVPASLASVCGCGDADLALPVSLAIPGMHNARNATAAILAAMLLGVTPEAAAQAASTFLGASRRFQVRGEENGVTVVDDYAHHPTEISALLDAARAGTRVPSSGCCSSHTCFRARVCSPTSSPRRCPRPMTSSSPASSPHANCSGTSRTFRHDHRRCRAGRAARFGAGRWDVDQRGRDMQVAAQMLAMRCRPTDVVFTVGAGGHYRHGRGDPARTGGPAQSR